MHGSLELVYILVFKRVIQTIRGHLSLVHLLWDLALLRTVIWTHVPTSLTVRGWRAHNRPTVCTVMWLCLVLGLSMHFGACSWSEHIEVCFGEPETTSLKEENGRRPIFFIFWPNEVL